MRRFLVGLTTLLTVLVFAAPAQASVRSFGDPRGDGSDGSDQGLPGKFGDIGKVRVDHGKDKVYVRISPAKGGKIADSYEIWVDVNASNPGPEFSIFLERSDAPKAVVSNASAFRVRGSVTCRPRSATYDVTKGIARVGIRRACLGGSPQEVRLNVTSSMDYEHADDAPGVDKFGPWVSAG